MNEPFNAKAAMAELLEGMKYPPHRMPFAEKCAALCALRGLIPREVVMKAFNITSGTASHLANCVPLPELVSLMPPSETDKPIAHLPNRRGPKKRLSKQRYSDVADEFNWLGEDEFARTYYTDEVHMRLMRAKYLSENEHKMKRPKGRPGQFAGVHLTSNGPYLIEFRNAKDDPSIGGWLFAYANEHGQRAEGSQWRGAETGNLNLDPDKQIPFDTAREAYEALMTWVEQ